MSRTRAFFLEEAAECLGVARRELQATSPSPARLHAAVRQLRGSAQMARYGQAARIAAALEARLKPVARGGEWSESVAEATREATRAIEALLDAVEAGRLEPDARVETRMDTEPKESGMDAVDARELEYRGDAALDRALRIRPALEEAIVAEERVDVLLDELFDLIRLART